MLPCGNEKKEFISYRNETKWSYIEFAKRIYRTSESEYIANNDLTVTNVRDKGKNQYQYLGEFHKKEDNSNQPYGHKDLRRTLDELSLTDSIPQNVPIVNSNSMQN